MEGLREPPSNEVQPKKVFGDKPKIFDVRT